MSNQEQNQQQQQQQLPLELDVVYQFGLLLQKHNHDQKAAMTELTDENNFIVKLAPGLHLKGHDPLHYMTYLNDMRALVAYTGKEKQLLMRMALDQFMMHVSDAKIQELEEKATALDLRIASALIVTTKPDRLTMFEEHKDANIGETKMYDAGWKACRKVMMEALQIQAVSSDQPAEG